MKISFTIYNKVVTYEKSFLFFSDNIHFFCKKINQSQKQIMKTQPAIDNAVANLEIMVVVAANNIKTKNVAGSFK